MIVICVYLSPSSFGVTVSIGCVTLLIEFASPSVTCAAIWSKVMIFHSSHKWSEMAIEPEAMVEEFLQDNSLSNILPRRLEGKRY